MTTIFKRLVYAGLISGLMLGVHVSVVSAQSPRPAPTPAVDARPSTFTAPDKAFTIAIGKTPASNVDRGEESDLTEYIVDIAAGTVDITQEDFKDSRSAAVMDAMIDSIIAERRNNPGNSLTDVKPVTVNGFRGKSFSITSAGFGYLDVLVAKDTRFFDISCQYKIGRDPNDRAVLQKILDSFAPAAPTPARKAP